MAIFGQAKPSNLFGQNPNPSNNLFGISSKPGGLFGSTSQPSGPLFGQPQSNIFGSASTNIFAQSKPDKKQDADAEDSDACFVQEDEAPTVTLGTNLVQNKSPFVKVIEFNIDKFKISKPLEKKKNLQNGKVSVQRGEFGDSDKKVLWCKVVFQNTIGKTLYNASITGNSKHKAVIEKNHKNQLKISVVFTNDDKSKENQFCLINFRRDEDLKEFQKKF